MTGQGFERTRGHVVVAVDGSPSSLQALRQGRRLGEALGKPVAAVSVWHNPPLVPPSSDLAHDARLQLREAVRLVYGDGPNDVDQIVVQGQAADVLQELSPGAELIVLGTRGHSGLAGALLGSVSGQVAAHADCPVMVVRATKD